MKGHNSFNNICSIELRFKILGFWGFGVMCFWGGQTGGVMSFSGIHIGGVMCFLVFQDNELRVR